VSRGRSSLTARGDSTYAQQRTRPMRSGSRAAYAHPIMDDHFATPVPSDRYREMAAAVLALVPMLRHREVVADIYRLAGRYERLADFLTLSSSPGQDVSRIPTPHEK
jgi:hypothetical protein